MRDVTGIQRGTALRARAGLVFAFVAIEAHCTPYFDQCDNDREYEERVERIVRDAWPRPLEPLVIRLAVAGRNEVGIGLGRSDDGFELVRLEFAESFWYSSWRRLEADADPAALTGVEAVVTEVFRSDGAPLGAEVLDFTRTRVRVASQSIPVSDPFAEELINVLKDIQAAEQTEEGASIVVDGTLHEIMKTRSACLSTRSPPRESVAGQIVGFFRFLENEMPNWRPRTKEVFETDARNRLREITGADPVQ